MSLPRQRGELARCSQMSGRAALRRWGTSLEKKRKIKFFFSETRLEKGASPAPVGERIKAMSMQGIEKTPTDRLIPVIASLFFSLPLSGLCNAHNS